MKDTAFLIADLAYGDCGKGTMTDYLCWTRGARMVVRYNGGPQAGHNVVLPDGRHHCFSQFGSGSFTGADTYLSRFMLVEPYAFFNEHEVLEKTLGVPYPLSDVHIERGAPVITPFHWLTNRAREIARGDSKHGSCGQGVGELRADQADGQHVMTVGDLADWNWARRYEEMCAIRDRKIEEVLEFGGDPKPLQEESIYNALYCYERFAKKADVVPNDELRWIYDGGAIVFEGAQGVLLDETHGCAPHNTWTDTTYANAHRLLQQVGINCERIGVVRTYFTRHGAGPFPTEVPGMEHPEPHNTAGHWQGKFRQGYFDAQAIRYAIKVCGGVDRIAVTHCDRFGTFFTYSDGCGPEAFCHAPNYQHTSRPPWSVISDITGVNVGWISSSPTFESKKELMGV